MITNKITEVDIKTGTIHTLPAAIGVGLFTGVVGAVILNTEWLQVSSEMPQATLSTLGSMLLNEYVLIFELLGILLLVALIGAASMARK
jgi:NADH-quinone oxidoreductase subunit J